MNQLNSRQIAILKYLLRADQPVSADELGAKIGISGRIVRHNIAFINAWLESFGLQIQSKTNLGLSLVCPDEIAKKILAELLSAETSMIYTPKDRQYLILFEILSRSGEISEEELRSKLNVSRTTLSHDWNWVEQWLNQRNLFITHRTRAKVSVQGRENDFRHALISLLLELGIESELISLCLWGIKPTDIKSPTISQAASLILNVVSGWELTDGWNVVSYIENEFVSKLDDGDHLVLTLYWVILRRRTQQKCFINLSDERINYLSSRPEYAIVQATVERLLERISLSLPRPEIAQLTLEVMTTRGEFKVEGDSELIQANQEKTSEIASRLIIQVGKYLGTDLENSEVIKRLSVHLSRVVIRMKFGLPFQNKLTDEIKQAYPLLWQATLKATNEVWDEAGPPLPAEEIAFITMYMALAIQLNKNEKHIKQNPMAVVACPSGGVTVWMLVSRLRTELPEIKEVISLRDISNVNPDEIDIIISTAKVNSPKIKSVTVNPLLGDEDIFKIRKELGLIKESKQ
jgi:mannitol operon transcriptional antiterminator